MKKFLKIGLAVFAIVSTTLGINEFAYNFLNYSIASDVLTASASPVVQNKIEQPHNFNPEHMPYYLRMKQLSNCQAGYSFFIRWASITASFGNLNEIESEEFVAATANMSFRALNKYKALTQLILQVNADAIKHGVNPNELKTIAKSEYIKASTALTQLFLLSTERGSKEAGEFFKGLLMGDKVCQKFVADVVNNKDLEEGYYTSEGPVSSRGTEVSFQSQK